MSRDFTEVPICRCVHDMNGVVLELSLQLPPVPEVGLVHVTPL